MNPFGLPLEVGRRLDVMYAPPLAEDVAAYLLSCQAALTAVGLPPEAVERALVACLMAVERQTAEAPSWERNSQNILVRAEAAAARCVSDTRGLLLAAGIEASDWHSHLVWEPVPQPAQLDFPEPLDSLVRACETRCVTACCGLDAYEVRADSLVRWAGRDGDAPALVSALTQLETELTAVARVGGPVRGHSMLLDHEWPTAADCLHYFDDWRLEASRALAEVGGPAVLRPEWLTPAVRAVAAGVAASRDFSQLPVLADALDDAGCDSEPLLAHLRAGGRHGWFCWAVDLLADR